MQPDSDSGCADRGPCPSVLIIGTRKECDKEKLRRELKIRKERKEKKKAQTGGWKKC